MPLASVDEIAALPKNTIIFMGAGGRKCLIDAVPYYERDEYIKVINQSLEYAANHNQFYALKHPNKRDAILKAILSKL